MSEVLWFVLALAVCAGLYWLAYRIEPHYSSRDGRRFLATGQFIDAQGQPEGRPREFRAVVIDRDLVQISRRFHRRKTAEYRLLARAPDLSRRRAVYLLQSTDPQAYGDQISLRLPPSSHTSQLFDRILADRRY